jgi:hypothetical protein
VRDEPSGDRCRPAKDATPAAGRASASESAASGTSSLTIGTQDARHLHPELRLQYLEDSKRFRTTGTLTQSACLGRSHLTDRQWAFIKPLLPPPAHPGRPRSNDRRPIEGIIYVRGTGCCWQDLPSEYGAPITVWRRLRR